MVCSKNFFIILTKNVKTKCRKESTWEGGEWSWVARSKLLVLTTFTIHFILCLIFIRVWPIEDFLFEIRQIKKIFKQSLKTMYPPGYVGSRNTQVFINKYIYRERENKSLPFQDCDNITVACVSLYCCFCFLETEFCAKLTIQWSLFFLL